MNFYASVITLILVLDPLGNIPIFLSLLRKLPEKRQKWVMLRETLIAFAILLLFLLFGGYILQGLHLTMPDLSIAGGVILFLIAIKMIFPNPKDEEAVSKDEPLLVPLAVPLIAGPSSLATVLLLAARTPPNLVMDFFALLTAFVIFTAIISSSHLFMRLLGPRALSAMERLMGMILTAVAVQMFLTGLTQYLRTI